MNINGRVTRQTEKIAARLKVVRLSKPGIGGSPRSQNQFAKQLGVWQQYLSRYEKGTIPCPEFLIHLAQQEDVNLNWLLLGKGTQRCP